jgi:hypothetical protein
MSLTPAECEALVILAEECAEVAQRATKILRFGTRSWPTPESPSNTEKLENELGDLITAMGLVAGVGLIDMDRVAAAGLRKHEQFKSDPSLLQHIVITE